MKIIFLPLFLLLTASIHTLAQAVSEVAFVKTEHNQWQLIDRNAHILADSLSDEESLAYFSCSNNAVVFTKNGKMGLKNFKNEVIVKADYDSISYFRNKQAVGAKSGKYYLLDAASKFLPITYEQSLPFFLPAAIPNCIDGFCLTETDSLINCKTPDGKFLLASSDDFVAPWNDVASFRNNRILKYKIMANKVCSCQKPTSYYGFVDCSGKWIIEPSYEQADIFSCGLAAVSEGSENIYTYGYIDMNGQWIIEPIYKEAHRFERVEP